MESAATINPNAFDQVKSNLLQFLDRTRKVHQVNKFLRDFNWLFVHPYMIGMDVSQLEKLSFQKTATKEDVLKIFAYRFMDLRFTTSMIEGFYKRRPHLKSFCHLIDQSVFMCLQRDYAGAINTLLPVIEGSIRSYLNDRNGTHNKKLIGTSGILKAFNYLKDDFLKIKKSYYIGEYQSRDGVFKFDLDSNQIKQLMKYESEYIDIWFSAIKEYFEHSLYLDTRNGDLIDPLNRHSIFHGFTSDIYYSFENYLKVFNCISFLSWAFGLADVNASVLAVIDDKEEYNIKWKAFEKIRAVSKLTTKIKSSVYKTYDDFDIDEFERTVVIDRVDRLISSVPAMGMEHRMRFIDESIPTLKG